jgi:hypothetical protein
MCMALRAVEGLLLGYKGIQGAFEELWKSGAGSAEESVILQGHGQGGVEASRGLEDPILPLSAPTGMQLAPTSQKVRKVKSAHYFALWTFSEVVHSPGPMLQGFLCGIANWKRCAHTFSAKLALNVQKYCERQ